MPINNGKSPNAKDQVVSTKDIARKALQHITWEIETFNAKVKANNAQDNAGKAMRHNAEKALAQNNAREALQHNAKKVLEYGDSPDAKNQAGTALNNARKALWHDIEKALEYNATEALNINEPYTEFISEVMLYKCARKAESGDN